MFVSEDRELVYCLYEVSFEVKISEKKIYLNNTTYNNINNTMWSLIIFRCVHEERFVGKNKK